ncbi:EDD domain protein, DegV family [Paenibacillus larvae subsp. larvae DSM 25430]|uniref:EDD domain protein, DegV family n=2 Tax=Paenibacillus larvae TaxID=1464 RepID=V9W8F1_9BACL|nr:EDD domain protein, DegV family [Paenibacillus larvae subsp. larvae DSM 25430]
MILFMTIKLITDGSSDLPKKLVEEMGITVVPLSVHFSGEEFTSDMDMELFYHKMKTEKELPKTSSPSPYQFVQEYVQAGDRDILVLALSSSLSSTYLHAKMAKQMFEEEGHKNRIVVMDTRTTSVGLGLLVYRVAKMIKDGMSFDQIVGKAGEMISDTIPTYFCLDTLENVVKGGRLDRVRGAVASVLNIKLLMKGSTEGTLEIIEKVRGRQNAMKRLIEKVTEKTHDFEKAILGIAHSNCEERAKSIIEQIVQKAPFRKVIISDMGPVIGTYAGEGGIVISY